MSRALGLGLGLVFSLAVTGRAAPAQEESRGLRIVWVDVEGGAATLIVAPSGEALLVDAGWPGKRDAERIAAAARAEGLARIDHVLVTHFHTDHWGGIADLARAIPLGRFYDRGLPDADDEDVDRRIRPELRAAYVVTTGDRRSTLRAGDVLQLGDARIEILCANGVVGGEEEGAPQSRPCRAEPAHASREDDETDNALSVGFLLRLGAFEFLALGDLTWNVEHKLVCPENRIGTIDVYQSTHHGHEHSNNPALLAAARPAVVVVGNGPRKGASPATLAWLRAVPDLADVFQLHRNVAASSVHAAAPELVANHEEDCRGAGIRLTLDPAEKTYTVEVPSRETRRTYPVR